MKASPNIAETEAPALVRRGGRPTKAAAAERDERLLDIATRMFLDQGFDATSMDGVAEAAAIGKATLYARYTDKTALFADVLRRRILLLFVPIEAEIEGALDGTDLQTALALVARRFLEKSLAPESIALGRILSSQGHRFPELARLAVHESWGRQTRLVETVLNRFAGNKNFALDDLPLAADLFISIVLGRASRLAMLGVTIDPRSVEHRAKAAVQLFIRGLLTKPSEG